MADCKGLLIIVDGLGDRSCPALGGQTPLEAASTPQLDRLA
jgi:2,3-bisphosphoglycerate-independent phosphoglycerate mutase